MIALSAPVPMPATTRAAKKDDHVSTVALTMDAAQ